MKFRPSLFLSLISCWSECFLGQDLDFLIWEFFLVPGEYLKPLVVVDALEFSGSYRVGLLMAMLWDEDP